ncbi:MAG: hypothetical protein ABMA26_06375 [Limisphaerales bacterium]
MIKLSELLIAVFAASLPVTYVLLMRHFILKNEAEDLANLAKSGPMDPHECCCESAAKALTGKSESNQTVAAH